MKKIFAALVAPLLATPIVANAENLMQVYQQALHSDPTYLQAVAQHESDMQGVPIARADILPSIQLLGTAGYDRQNLTGSAVIPNGRYTSKSASYDLQLTQTVFDMSQFDTLGQAKLVLEGNDATYSAAIQDLMSRVAVAYFAVLKAREELRYSYANMESLGRQFQQTEQQYRVGLKTRSDVDLAQSSYDNAVAQHIATINDLSNAREDLRAITGVYYNHLAILRKDLPLISPYPADPNKWVNVAKHQNWTVKSFMYAAQAAKRGIDVQWDGHLPTLSVQADYVRSTSRKTAGFSQPYTPADSTTAALGPTVALNLTVPIFEGGLINANTRQAEADYEVAQKQYDFNLRDAINQTRQAYLAILSGISQIKADRQAVVSGESALAGDKAGYRVGTKTIVEVLKTQDTLFQAQTQYAEDRFNYITNSIKLKEETGTLSANDLRAINNWLTESQSDFKAEQTEAQQPTISTYRQLPASNAKVNTVKTTAKPASKPLGIPHEKAGQ